MRISFLELGFLLIVLTFMITWSVYLLGKSSGTPQEMILRRCGIALVVCLVAATGFMTHMLYYFPQLFEREPIMEQVQPTPPPATEPTESQMVELPVIDYAEILRNSEEYDGKEVRVAGRIARLGFASSKYSFYFRDRLGFLEIGKDFEVELSRQFLYLAHDEEVGDYYFKNQYVLVQGVWQHSKRFPALRNAEVITTGEEAQEADQVFMDTWMAAGKSYSKFPITDYMELAEDPGHYLGQRVRVVGQVQSVGDNAVAWDKYFSFRARDSQKGRITFSLQGCPPEMQKTCIEGEYAVISCLVAEDDYGTTWFADCFVECVDAEAEAIFNQFYTE